MNFKSYFFLGVLLVFSVELKAQLIALSGGMNLSNRHQSRDCMYLEFKPVVGYNFNFSYEQEIRRNFFFVTGLRLNSIGYDLFPDQYYVTKNLIKYKIQERIYHFHYLNVPVLFKHSHKIDRQKSLFIVAGPYAGVAFTGSLKEFIQPESDLSVPVTMEKNRLRTFRGNEPFLDFGLTLGAGITLNRWSLEMNYVHGLRNYDTSYDDVKTMSRSFSVNLGYYLKR